MIRPSSIGVVVIGRNEGERLRACLRSLQDVHARVYVDSGSTDGSQELARALGFAVIELATPPGFTAARARNAGVELLVERHPDLSFVQMVDGDCEVRAGWLDAAARELEDHPDRAVTFGRRRERKPDANAYHMVCDSEWNVPLGAVNSCGGDAMFRLSAFREVGGYKPELIAGEEPDLCLRLRGKGWRIWSNGAEMTWHDIAMNRFAQWWRRSKRTGFAFTELVRRHGDNADPSWARLLRSALAWTAIVLLGVAALLALAIEPSPLLAVLSCIAPALVLAQIVRLALKRRALPGGFARGLAWAWLIMTAKLAEAQGWAQFHIQRWRGRQSALIEYKR